jgi:hypothetical protein
MKKYYIYHIPTFVHKDGRIGKIGCTEEEDAKVRVQNQGYTEYEILETHTDIMIASNREIELQKEYGYPVDKIPYHISRKQWGSPAGKKGGQKCLEIGQFHEMIANRDKNYLIEQGTRLGKMCGPENGKSAVESGNLATARIKAFETNFKLVTCPYCGKEGKKLNMSRWHGTNCKNYATL